MLDVRWLIENGNESPSRRRLVPLSGVYESTPSVSHPAWQTSMGKRQVVDDALEVEKRAAVHRTVQMRAAALGAPPIVDVIEQLDR
jgi:hypothetical protein